MVWYTSSISVSTPTTGLPRSAARRWMSARAYSGSAQPRSPSGYELSSQALLIVPADDPYTASKAGTSSSSCSARAIPPEMVPRIPPPSMTSATRRPSPRPPGPAAGALPA